MGGVTLSAFVYLLVGVTFWATRPCVCCYAQPVSAKSKDALSRAYHHFVGGPGLICSAFWRQR